MLSHIGKGRDAARSIGSLCEATGRARRAVERDLEALVLSGVPLVASDRGVYIASSPQEARQYADSLDGRIAAISARSRALRAWADDQETGLVQTSWLDAA